MNSAMKLGLTLVLGVVAGAMNWYVVQSKVSPVIFVRAKKAIKEGETFTREMIEPLAGHESWSRSVVPYSRRDSIIDLRAPRAYAPGDLVLWRDIQQSSVFALQEGEDLLQIALEQVRFEPALLKVGSTIGFVVPREAPAAAAPAMPGYPPAPPDPSAGWPAPVAGTSSRDYEVLGPFRIVTLGQFVRDPDPKEARNFRTIGVATKLEKTDANTWQFPPEASRLMAASTGGRIVSLVLFQQAPVPSTEPTAATTAATSP